MFRNNLISEKIYNIYQFIVQVITSHISTNLLQKYETYIKLSVAVYNVVLFSILLLIFINTISNYFFKKNNLIYSIIKYINFSVTSLIILLIIIKFTIGLKVESVVGAEIHNIRIIFFRENTNLGILEHFTCFTTIFSDCILLLAILIGLLCVDLLGSKDLVKNLTNMNVFYFFIFFVTLMVTTTNLLIMFISFEFIFLPTIYFAYTLGYSKKIDKATEILFY